MNIRIDTKTQIFKTIGHTDDFKPVLWFKIGQRKQAIEDLANFYNRFSEVLATGIELTNEDYIKYNEQFAVKARAKALELINNILDCETMYKDRFFSFLR